VRTVEEQPSDLIGVSWRREKERVSLRLKLGIWEFGNLGIWEFGNL
jgi:hypothetical protein